MATHTPGPWRLHDGMIQCQGKWSDATGDHFDWTYPRVLADVSDDWDQAANGSVMAAAPDLLALAHQYRDDLRYPPTADSITRRLAAIDAVLAKVTGE